MTETRLHDVHSTAAPAELVADSLVIGTGVTAVDFVKRQLDEQPDALVPMLDRLHGIGAIAGPGHGPRGGREAWPMPPDTETSARPADPTLRTLLYRYVFFAWLFKDAGRGSQYERAAAWRHNVEQARWLPTYMRRYTVSGLLLVGLGCATELPAPLLSVLFFLPGLVTVPMTAVAFVCWVRLRTT